MGPSVAGVPNRKHGDHKQDDLCRLASRWPGAPAHNPPAPLQGKALSPILMQTRLRKGRPRARGPQLASVRARFKACSVSQAGSKAYDRCRGRTGTCLRTHPELD